MDIESLYGKFLLSGKVSTDTRQIAPGAIFFALKGPNFNANALAEEALQKGASYAVVDEQKYVTHSRILLVEDGLLALQQLAKHHRAQLHLPVIGLTGSNGKTTTKELIHAVLSQKFETVATRGNLNNHIGVPITVLGLNASTQIAVVEMGANHLGEIALLSEIAMPTHGLITNIGKAHVGTFGGFENIIRGKGELYHYLLSHQGRVFVHSGSAVLYGMSEKFEDPMLYPAPGDYYHCELISADPFLRLRAENGEEVGTQLVGSYNFENIAAALCIGKFFGVEATLANRAVAEYVPRAMRSQVVQQASNRIILDAYNANPSSMEAAIQNLARMKASRKIVILGDMYELEGESDAEHRKVGSLLREHGIAEVYLCGVLIKKALETFPGAHYFTSKTDLLSHLEVNPIREATILVKASRGMGLETILPALG